MNDPTVQEVLTALRYHGGAQLAIDSGKFDSPIPGTVTPVGVELRNLILRHPQDMLRVRGGTRLIDQGTRERFIMTHIGLVVNINSGHILNYRDLPYPLEIYRYGRS